MKRSLFSSFSFSARNLLFSSPKFEPKPKFQQPITALVGLLIRPRLRLYSSESNSSRETNIKCSQNNSIDDAGDISVEEIKRMIDKFYEGDEEVLPDIFEAVLMKQLNGTPGDDLMKELNLKPPADDAEKTEGPGLDEPRKRDDES